jgi:hypothetical protein
MIGVMTRQAFVRAAAAWLVLLVFFAIGISVPAVRAQTQGGQTQVPVLGQTQAQAQEPAAPVPLQVEVVLTRYDGDTEVSRLPFTLLVNANHPGSPRMQTSIRMGVQVPVPSSRSGDGGTAVTYQDVGTQIDCLAVPSGDGFALQLSIQDSSLYEPSGSAQIASPMVVAGYPVIRSFRSTTNVSVRDGQTMEYTMATDKISGEVLRVSVTATVLR